MKLSDVLRAIGAMGANPSLSSSSGKSRKDHPADLADGWTAPEMSADQIQRIQERIVGALDPVEPRLLSPTGSLPGEDSLISDEEIQAFISESQPLVLDPRREAQNLSLGGREILDLSEKQSLVTKIGWFRKRILVGGLTLGVLLTSLAAVALVYASPGPRSLFYPVRIGVENWRVTLASSELQESRVLLSITSATLSDLDEIADPNYEELTGLIGRINATETRALELLKGTKPGQGRNESLGRLVGISQTHVNLVRSMAAETRGPSRELLLHSRSVGERILGEAQRILFGQSLGKAKHARTADILTTDGLTPGTKALDRMPQVKPKGSLGVAGHEPEPGQPTVEGDPEVPNDTQRRCDVTNGVLCIAPPQIPSIPSP